MKIKLTLVTLVLMSAFAVSAFATPVATYHGTGVAQAQHPHNGHRGGWMSVMKKLNLTKEQDKKIHAIMSESRTKMKSVRTSNAAPAAKKQEMRRIQKESRSQINAVLTPAQRAKLKSMMANHKKNKPAPKP